MLFCYATHKSNLSRAPDRFDGIYSSLYDKRFSHFYNLLFLNFLSCFSPCRGHWSVVYDGIRDQGKLICGFPNKNYGNGLTPMRRRIFEYYMHRKEIRSN